MTVGPDHQGGPIHGLSTQPDDPISAFLDRTDDDIRRQARLDSELQPDPELAEGPASGGKMAMFAVAIAVVLGAVFYGLKSPSVHQAGTSSTAQNTALTMLSPFRRACATSPLAPIPSRA